MLSIITEGHPHHCSISSFSYSFFVTSVGFSIQVSKAVLVSAITVVGRTDLLDLLKRIDTSGLCVDHGNRVISNLSHSLGNGVSVLLESSRGSFLNVEVGDNFVAGLVDGFGEDLGWESGVALGAGSVDLSGGQVLAALLLRLITSLPSLTLQGQHLGSVASCLKKGSSWTSGVSSSSHLQHSTS